MSLTFGAPPPELARELEQVRTRARALAASLGSVNVPLPEDFPKAQILAIAAEMAELPEGTAQGSLQALEYVDTRLADIRSVHFRAGPAAPAHKGDQPPAPARDEGLDRELSGLIAAIATARRVARRIAALEPEEGPPEPSVPRSSASGLAEAESKGERAFDEWVAARRDFDANARPISPTGEDFRRQLTDAKVLTGLGRVELAQQNIIPAWLKRFGGSLVDVPARIEQAGQALEVGVDIVETVHGGWRRYTKKLFGAGYESAREFAVDLQALGRRLAKPRMGGAPIEPFSITKMRERILAGEPLPEEWVGFIDELYLSSTILRDLAPPQNLIALRRLGLAGTLVADLSPLNALTSLEMLDLDGTPISDLRAAHDMTKLRRLNIRHTKVTYTSVLAHLTAREITGP